MRYITTSTPPRAITSDYGLRIEAAERISWSTDRTADSAKLCYHGIRAAATMGYRSVVLQNVANTQGDSIEDDRDYWTRAFELLAKHLAGDDDLGITAIAIDHARYPERREAKETAFLFASIVAPLEEAIGDRCDIGMFGAPRFSPAVWTHAADYASDVASVYPEFDAADDVPTEWNPSAVAWVPMPGQWRPGREPATLAEFAGVLDFVRRGGIRTVCLWSDHRYDDRGRPKTTPQHWDDTLAGIAIVEGRRVEVPEWSPPSWMPVVDQAGGTE